MFSASEAQHDKLPRPLAVTRDPNPPVNHGSMMHIADGLSQTPTDILAGSPRTGDSSLAHRR